MTEKRSFIYHDVDLDGNCHRTEYVRISKTAAKKVFDANQELIFVPSNFWPCERLAFRASTEQEIDSKENGWTFETYVRNYEYYNCNQYETGYYTQFYVASKDQKL